MFHILSFMSCVAKAVNKECVCSVHNLWQLPITSLVPRLSHAGAKITVSDKKLGGARERG